MKPVLALFVVLSASTLAAAQKLDAAFVAGSTFTTDAQELVAGTCLTPCSLIESFSTGHHVFFAATGAFRVANFRLASLSLEAPVAVIPSAPVTITNVFGTSFKSFQKLSTLFVTPSIRLKLVPGAPVSPWASVGGGWARYSFASAFANNKGALQFGGGVDIKSGLPLLGFSRRGAGLCDRPTGFCGVHAGASRLAGGGLSPA